MCKAAIKLLAAIALCGALVSTALADDAEDQFAIAASHYSAKRWDMAIDGFRKFLHEYPDHAKHCKAMYFEAEALVQLGRYADASPIFLDVIAEAPAGPFARQSLFRVAEAAMKCGKTDEAQLRFSQFESEYPNDKLNAGVLLYRGNLSLHSGDAAAAEQSFRQSVERFGDLPTGDECRLGLVKSLEMQKLTDQCEPLLREIAQHDHNPWTEMAILQLAGRELAANKPQAALELFDSIEKRFPNSPLIPQAHLGGGHALYQLARYDDAVKQLNALTSNKELASEAKYWLALVRKSQERQKVVAATAKAAELAAQKTKDAAEAKEKEKEIAAASSRRDPKPSTAAVAPPLKNPVAEALTPISKPAETEQASAAHDEQVRRRSATIRYQAADAMIQSGDYGRAIATLQIGDNSGDDPRSLANRYLLATALKAGGRNDDAMQILDALSVAIAAKMAQSVSPDDRAALRALNDNVQLSKGESLAACERYAEAIEPLQNYLATPKKDAAADRARSTLALCYAHTGRLEEARRTVEELKASNPRSDLIVSTSLEVAEAASAAGQHKIAADMFEVLASDESSSETVAKGLAGLGRAQLQAGDNAAAAESFAKFLERFPKDPQAPDITLARGQAIEAQGIDEAALSVYRQALTKYPKAKALPQILAAAAGLSDRLQKDEEAAALYERLVREYPDSPEADVALYGRAWCLRDLGRGNESEKIFRQLYDQHPNSRYWADATFRLAERAVQRGDRTVADTYLDQLMAIGCPAPVLEHALYLLGQTAVGEQKWAAAETPLKRIVDEFPDGELRLPAEFWLAEVAYRQGDYAAAQQRFDTLMPRIAKHDQAWMAMVPLRSAQMLADQKQWASAREMAETIAHDYPQFNQQFEADYVIARALSAEGDLDGTRVACLRVVRSAAGSKTETAAMAQCLIGDSYLAQDSTATALREYLRVEIVYPFPHWQATALLKAAKCQEQLGHTKEAAELYARVRQNYQETEVVASAVKRSADTTRK